MTKHKHKQHKIHSKTKYRHKIEEEIHAKYSKRIDYLVGANNELMKELKGLESELTHKDYVSIPNATADCIILEENF